MENTKNCATDSASAPTTSLAKRSYSPAEPLELSALTAMYPGIGDMIAILPEIPAFHARTSPVYQYLDGVAKATVAASTLAAKEGKPTDLGAFGSIIFPYTKMGAIDSLDLFGLDELIIFSFYWRNRNRYRRSADIGGNLGLHSVLMDRCGWQVKTFEPDPFHASVLRRNLQLNGSIKVELNEAAISDRVGTLEFVRVLGNTTSSHLAGSKSNAYGELEKFPVRVEAIGNVAPVVDFMKVDAEGQEKNIIVSISADHWRQLDMMVEIGTPENARGVFDYLQHLGLHSFAQKLGWSEARSLADMPTSYKDGSLFISHQAEMPWA